MYITKKEMLAEIKQAAKENGFTFKVNNRKMINNQTCYKLCFRYTDNVVIDKWGKRLSNFTLDTGYQCMQTGCFNQLAGELN